MIEDSSSVFVFITVTLWKETVFWRIFLNMSWFDVFSNEIGVMDLGNTHRGDVTFAAHAIRGMYT